MTIETSGTAGPQRPTLRAVRRAADAALVIAAHCAPDFGVPLFGRSQVWLREQ